MHVDTWNVVTERTKLTYSNIIFWVFNSVPWKHWSKVASFTNKWKCLLEKALLQPMGSMHATTVNTWQRFGTEEENCFLYQLDNEMMETKGVGLAITDLLIELFCSDCCLLGRAVGSEIGHHLAAMDQHASSIRFTQNGTLQIDAFQLRSEWWTFRRWRNKKRVVNFARADCDGQHWLGARHWSGTGSRCGPRQGRVAGYFPWILYCQQRLTVVIQTLLI